MLDRILLAAYVVGFILTFGYNAAWFKHIEPERAPETGVYIAGGLLTACIWPVYWPLRLSYKAFKYD